MADKPGFRVIVKINLPPEKEYHSGHSLIVQGDTASEVRAYLGEVLAGREKAPTENQYDQAQFILLRFAEYAQGDAVKAALGGTGSGGSGLEPAQAETSSSTSADAAAGADGSASAPDLASTKVLEAVAKKTGKSVEELGELTKAQATEMLKGGK